MNNFAYKPSITKNGNKTFLNTKKIPTNWRKSRMNLIYKGKGNRARASLYRPVKVTPAIYRMAMPAIKAEFLKRVEGYKMLGELQNGFRPARRLKDNLCFITQCIEISMAALCPHCFSRFMSQAEKRLEGSKLGFGLSHSRGGQVVEQRTSGLIYADDIVLLAENVIDLQRLRAFSRKKQQASALILAQQCQG